MNALRPSQLDRSLHGLWSLWELMHRIYPDVLMSNMWMFGDIVRWKEVAETTPTFFRQTTKKTNLLEKHRPTILKQLESLEQLCIDLDLDASLTSTRRLQRKVETAKVYPELAEASQELEGRIIDQLGNRLCLALTTFQAEFYQNPLKGWEDIVERFLDTQQDIEV